MTAETITPNDDGITPCDNWGAVSSRPLPVDDYQRQLDHIDTMLHEIKQTLDQLAPLLPLVPRALALLDPGRAMRRSLRRGKTAICDECGAEGGSHQPWCSKIGNADSHG